MISTCLVLLLLTAADAPDREEQVEIRVGSKSFTENVILGEMVVQLGSEAGFDVQHESDLGGTQVVFGALLAGELDIYPEYTGTIAQEILTSLGLTGEHPMRQALAERGLQMTQPLGFNNTYALGMKREVAERLGIQTISQLRNHPEMEFGFSNEFMERGDGWPSLRDRYKLPQTDVRGLQHSLAYRAIDGGDIQVMDTYSTDAMIQKFDLVTLEDDLGHFPRYEAVYLYRDDLNERAPKFVTAIKRLEGRISNQRMQLVNSRVDVDRVSEATASAEFLRREFSLEFDVRRSTLAGRLVRYTLEHLYLVVGSLAAAICCAVPLGVVAARNTIAGHVILSSAEVIQTIPGLALLIFLMPPVRAVGLEGTGAWPVIFALFLYSLLPIIRNTYAGIQGIPGSLRESAAVLGLSKWARLRLVELPLASRMILAGVKTTAVINVGYATLGGLIGAGGYGQPIMTGLRLSDEAKMMEGAIPAAVLALAVKMFFELAERHLVSQGLRIKPSES